ncbi:MAG: Type fimbrial biosis protein PilY1, partial [Myxococcaceae bacterium]|nr:Type fimbrial biosis protein PilY1 [Myxococcaceae bacterium]
TQYNTNATFKAQILGVEGMYSYPSVTAAASTSTGQSTPLDAYGWKPLSFPGCTSLYGVNAGARGQQDPVLFPGSMIPAGLSDSGSATSSVNASIQSSLLQVRPYGGTPIAGMLDDLRYYLNNEPDVKTGSDPYYTCRKRYAVLLTDGAPDTMFRNDPRFQCESGNDSQCAGGVCQCPYDTETNLATALTTRDGLKELFVVALNVYDASALVALDAIAAAGGSGAAYRSTSMTTLRTALDTVIRSASPDATSRSIPVVVNTGTALQLGGQQFQVTAGFKVGATVSDPWEGRLYRQRMGCSGSTAAQIDLTNTDGGDSFHTTLNLRTAARTLYSAFPAAVLSRATGSLFGYSTPVLPAAPNNLKPDGSAFGAYAASDSTYAANQLVEEWSVTTSSFDKNTTTNPAYFGDANGNGTSGEVADRDQISDYLRGLSANRVGKRLGDIYHSNPTVQLPLYNNADQTQVFDPLLRKYYADLLTPGSTATYPKGHYLPQIGYGRPGVVYVGSNDGILHAFNLDDWYDKNGTKWNAGYEFWGFTPPALFNKLAAVATPTHTFTFDGTPIVKDMITIRTAAGVTTMRTVLLAAVRGAPAFVALDVTFPEQPPKLLWQRTFPYLGNTTGQPALAQVRVNWGGEVQTRAVAILPGGKGSPASGYCNVNQYSRGAAPNSRTQVPCWNLQGRTLDVVDVETGALLQEFDGRHFHSPMTGGVAVDGVDLAQTRAAYMTDEDGILWRLSMYNPDPNKWLVQPIWDMYAGTATNFSDALVSAASPSQTAGRPAIYPPLLARDPATGTLTIVLGTGDVDNLSDAAPNRVISLKELRSVNASTSELAPATSSGVAAVTANWLLLLDNGEAVTGPLVMLDDTVYFASFTGPAGGAGNVCNEGSSRLVGADVRKTDPASAHGLPKPRLTPQAGGTPLVLQYKPLDALGNASNSLLLGLSLARDPVCIPGNPGGVGYNPLLAGTGRVVPTGGAAGGGAFHLRTMVAGGTAGTVMNGSTASDTSGQRQLNLTLPITNVARSVGWANSIE